MNDEEMRTTTSQVKEAENKSVNADNTTLMAVLAYIGPLVIVPYLSAKNNPFVLFHIRQGLVLFGLEIAVWFIGMMIWALYPILSFVNLGLIALSAFGILNAVNKREQELPLVGQLSKHIPTL